MRRRKWWAGNGGGATVCTPACAFGEDFNLARTLFKLPKYMVSYCLNTVVATLTLGVPHYLKVGLTLWLLMKSVGGPVLRWLPLCHSS
jgi:hypothetical protein